MASQWTPNAFAPSLNSPFPSLSSISKYFWDSPISTVVSSKDIHVSSFRLPACCARVNLLSGLPKRKPPSINSNLCSRPRLFSVISTPNFLPQFMPTHPDLLSLASCPSLMPTAFYILLHFGPESASLRNAITISTIEKCSPLSNVSSTGVTTSKDLSILSTFAQITRTWKSSCLRKS